LVNVGVSEYDDNGDDDSVLKSVSRVRERWSRELKAGRKEQLSPSCRGIGFTQVGGNEGSRQ